MLVYSTQFYNTENPNKTKNIPHTNNKQNRGSKQNIDNSKDEYTNKYSEI